MSSDKDDFLDAIDPLERSKLIKTVNSTFKNLDRQFMDELVEMEGFFYEEDEEDINFESQRNIMLLEYINKCEIPEECDPEENVFDLSRKIVHFIFRNGIIEDMHAGKYSYDEFLKIPENTPLEVISQLSDKDMMALNKYMMDRVGYLLHLLQNAEYTKLHYILDKEKYFGDDWDRPEIDNIEKDTEDLFLIEFSHQKDHDHNI
ncbi:hypothetical protein [Solibacillus merdavium]|uniref:DUF4375 domain-containing protein n=1 Tax=Solibacillus merdavium TaxID=2762218 RepID=A0ABR8XSD6_9BACL|nr:hypothetical protein [Solibacillus merdavium]MBD8034855.1 hypothetical protein [Solibacillus merdavium]